MHIDVFKISHHHLMTATEENSIQTLSLTMKRFFMGKNGVPLL